MSVLYDVLNIAKEKRYMVLDPVSQDPPENKATMHMVSKRKVNIRFFVSVENFIVGHFYYCTTQETFS